MKPERAILLARVSDARDAHGKREPTDKSVKAQVADMRKLAQRLEWGVGPASTHVIVENLDPDTGKFITNVSAFKRRKIRLPNGRVELRTVRPEYRRALDMLDSGQADGLIAVDLDRTCRDHRDLEDLIDVVEGQNPRIPVESVTGSLRLGTDADITMARVMVAMNNKSSRDTSRRVTRHMLRLAEEGKTYGGRRRYGLNEDGSIRDEEAVVIKESAERILAGVGISGVVKDLNRRGVPAHRGGKWESQSLRSMLMSPRIAGLSSFHGEVIEGVSAPWAAILDRGTWQALCALLSSPERRTSPGPTPKHLLSHVALCGHPSHPDDDRPVLVHGWSGGGRWRVPSYKCVSQVGHLSCASAGLDDLVEAVVLKRLSRPDAAELLAPRVEVDMNGLAREANALRARITELGDMWEAGDFGGAEYRKRKARMTEKLTGIEAQMTAAAGTSPLAGIAGREDAGELWDQLDLGRKKAVIDTLMTVTVLPARRRGKGFDIDRVQVVPRI